MKSKKELKDQYKQMKFKMGVFQIENTVNGKIYIESSLDLNSIWNRYRFQLNGGLHKNAELQKDWTKYGEEKFSYKILGEIEQTDAGNVDYRREVKKLEKLIVEELQNFGDKAYNISRNV